MTHAEHTPRYSHAEEIANAVIHGIGIVLAIIGLTVLVTFSAMKGDVLHVVGSSVFGATMILMYVASTLYHAITHTRVKELLRSLDHSAIYLLIAGTYTPFCLVTLQGVWGWSLFSMIWSLALVGVLLRLIIGRKSGKLSVLVYILMGWSVVVAFKPLLASINDTGFAFLVAGGVTYTVGVLFYVKRTLPFHHAIWHLFVLGGTVLHFFAVLYGVIPGMTGQSPTV